MERLSTARDGVFHYATRRGRRRWGADFRRADGRRGRRLGFPTKRAAAEFLRDYRKTAGGPQLGPALDEYVADRRRLGFRPSSYFYLLRFWRRAIGPDRELDEIDSAEVDELAYRYVLSRELAASSRNRLLSQLSGAFRYFRRRRWVVGNPAQPDAVPRDPELGRARERVLELEEIAELVELAPAWLGRIIRVAAQTGLRLGELCSLEVRDLEPRALKIRRSKNRRSNLVPISRELAEELAGVAGGREPGDYLLPGPRGRGSAYRAVQREFPPLVRSAGLPYGRGAERISFHTLRHSFATHARTLGVSERAIARLGNWRDRRMLDRYSHIGDPELERAAELVGAAVRRAGVAVTTDPE